MSKLKQSIIEYLLRQEKVEKAFEVADRYGLSVIDIAEKMESVSQRIPNSVQTKFKDKDHIQVRMTRPVLMVLLAAKKKPEMHKQAIAYCRRKGFPDVSKLNRKIDSYILGVESGIEFLQ